MDNLCVTLTLPVDNLCIDLFPSRTKCTKRIPSLHPHSPLIEQKPMTYVFIMHHGRNKHEQKRLAKIRITGVILSSNTEPAPLLVETEHRNMWIKWMDQYDELLHELKPSSVKVLLGLLTMNKVSAYIPVSYAQLAAHSHVCRRSCITACRDLRTWGILRREDTFPGCKSVFRFEPITSDQKNSTAQTSFKKLDYSITLLLPHLSGTLLRILLRILALAAATNPLSFSPGALAASLMISRKTLYASLRYFQASGFISPCTPKSSRAGPWSVYALMSQYDHTPISALPLALHIAGPTYDVSGRRSTTCQPSLPASPTSGGVDNRASAGDDSLFGRGGAGGLAPHAAAVPGEPRSPAGAVSPGPDPPVPDPAEESS